MQLKISRWGNSLALRIPATAAKELGLCEGSDVTAAVTGNGLVISPKRRRKYKLNELLAKMKDEDKPERILRGDAVGKEII